MNLLVLLLIVLLVLAVIGVPNLGLHSHGWAPSGILGTVLIILLILFLLGKI